MPRDVRVQQVVQLRGELDARRPAADDAEVEQLAPVCVGDCRLVRLFEACVSVRGFWVGRVSVSEWESGSGSGRRCVREGQRDGEREFEWSEYE